METVSRIYTSLKEVSHIPVEWMMRAALLDRRGAPGIGWFKLQGFLSRVIPRPFETIALSGRTGLVGAEVGVLSGWHSHSILKLANVKKLYLVDSYRAYWEYDQSKLDLAYADARRRLRSFRQVQFVREESSKAAELLPMLDFVYLDAKHDVSSVNEDIKAWWPKIKPGGVLGGHDFENGWQEWLDGVVKAVSKFAVLNGLRLRVDHPDWWVEKPLS